MTTPTPISEILSGDDLDRFAAHWKVSREIIPLAPSDAQPPFAPTGFKYETDADVRARVLARIRPAPEETPAKDWHTEAHRLFGYSLLCSNNHDAVARALGEIADVLAKHGLVEITVRHIPDEGEAAS
jgi:phage-related baseplate assembly protein